MKEKKTVVLSRKIQIVIGLLLTLGISQLPFGNLANRLRMFGPDTANDVLKFIFTGLILAYVLLIERRPLSSIGFRKPTWRTLAYGVFNCMVLLSGLVIIGFIVLPILHFEPHPHFEMAGWPFGVRLFTVACAATTEEITFRSYPIERVAEWSGQPWLGGALGIVAFVAAHDQYRGWEMIYPIWGGFVLTCQYVASRDLASNMLTHFLVDGLYALEL